MGQANQSRITTRPVTLGLRTARTRQGSQAYATGTLRLKAANGEQRDVGELGEKRLKRGRTFLRLRRVAKSFGDVQIVVMPDGAIGVFDKAPLGHTDPVGIGEVGIDLAVELPKRREVVKFDFRVPPRSGDQVAVIEHVSKAYGKRTIYDDFSMTIRRGERWAVMGRNGAGKTTLLKILSGNLVPDGGEVRLGASLKMGYFAQQSLDVLDADLTVLEQLQRDFPKDGLGALRTLAGLFTTSVLGWMRSKRWVLVIYCKSKGGSCRSKTTSTFARASATVSPKLT